MGDLTRHFEKIQERATEEAKADQRRELLKQQREGRCNLIPLPQVATQPFRAELVLESHPLFVVNAFKGDHFTYERTVYHPDSREPIVQSVRIGKLDASDKKSYGVLKQSHQQVFYKLLKLWGEQGYPLDGSYGVVSTTVYDLVKALRGDDAAHHYQRVRRLLHELASIPICYENAYTWQGLQDLEEFRLVGDIRWVVRKLDKQTLRPRPGGTSKVEILISKTVTEGFLNKHVKQLLWQPYSSLGSEGSGRRAELARLLYPLLDHELANKDTYHVALTSLARRFGMVPQRYRSDRRRPFVQAIRPLNGKEILGSRYKLDVKLVDSKDGEDYVLIARRAPYQLKLKGF